jgi:hypothetical protein
VEPDSPEHEAAVAEEGRRIVGEQGPELIEVPEGRIIEVEGGRYGLRPTESTPIPNRADNAWEDLLALREEARTLGIDVRDSWPINRLQREIARKRQT